MLDRIKSHLYSFKSQNKAQNAKRFFKTGKGQYSEKDIFIGIAVPEIRSIAKKFTSKELHGKITFDNIAQLLHSPIHEERALALMILIEIYNIAKDDKNEMNAIGSVNNVVKFYTKPENLQYINNWDLVDLSCYKILGDYLIKNTNEISILYHFALNSNMWIRRIAIVSTLSFIKIHNFEHTIKIAETLLDDKHDLIHKAAGWMLREVGKRDKKVLIKFLQTYGNRMPRMMFRYATEILKRNDNLEMNL